MEKARNSWGRNKTAKVSTGLKILTTRQDAEAIRAKINLPEKRPSSGPPGEIGLATPVFRHLASPRMAEKQERKKESRRKAGVLYTSPFNNISNTTCRRLGLSGEKITF